MSYDPSGLYLVRINETRNPSPIPYFVNAPNATTSTEVVEKSFEQEFSKAAEQYSGYFLLAAAATQTDTIAIGPADAAAAILVIALVVKCTSVALNNVSVPAITIPKLEAPAISIPKAEEKEGILPNLPPNNKTTYYHASTYSNALSII